VDVFAFLTVNTSKDSFSWRKRGEWLQRDLDKSKYHHVIPRDAILPLRWGNFSGVTGIIIPNDPKRTLQWDFGFVIDEPIFPHQLNRNVSVSPVSCIFILFLLLTSDSGWRFGAPCIAALLLLGGGLRIIALLALVAQPMQRKKFGSDFTRRFSRLVAVGLLVGDLLPLFPVAFHHSMEALGSRNFTMNPDRYCLFYKLLCIDQ
jgi:hypothetical protein